jgi:hypothetical protein
MPKNPSFSVIFPRYAPFSSAHFLLHSFIPKNPSFSVIFPRYAPSSSAHFLLYSFITPRLFISQFLSYEP